MNSWLVMKRLCFDSCMKDKQQCLYNIDILVIFCAIQLSVMTLTISRLIKTDEILFLADLIASSMNLGQLAYF